MKRTLVRALCFLLAWTTVVPAYAAGAPSTVVADEAVIRAQYPNARIIHVTPETYPQLAEQLRSEGYRPSGEGGMLRLAQNQVYETRSGGQYNGGARRKSRQDGCGSSGESQADTSVHLGVNIHGGSGGGRSGGGSAEEAAVLFVFIGVVMVVVWTLYLFKYLYDVSMGYHPCRWSEFTFSSTAISTVSPQHAYFNGINYKTGILDGGTEFGIVAEVGHSDIYLTDIGVLELEGFYWLLGPTLRWRMSSGRNPHYLEMGFVAGSTEHDEMGLLARADIGLRFGIGDAFNFGFSWGALNMQLNGDQSLISEREQFHYLYGFNMGYRF